MSMHSFSKTKNNQKGFTLIELLVVVSLLATMAGIAAVAMDGYEQQAESQLVDVEMKRIASAIYRFKEDTGYFPKEGMFAADALYGADSGDEKNLYENAENLSWIFYSPEVFDTNGDDKVDATDSDPYERLVWNANVSRGWNGPYLERSAQRSVVDNDVICGLDEANFHTGFDGSESVGLTDVFQRNTENGAESCAALKLSGSWTKKTFSGQAYRYFTTYQNNALDDCPDTGAGCIALVSAGEDGELDANSSDAVTNDLVYVLRVNP